MEKISSECRHEDCGALFWHYGAVTEPTCCPACGRQQMPNPTALALCGLRLYEETLKEMLPEATLQMIRNRPRPSD